MKISSSGTFCGISETKPASAAGSLPVAIARWSGRGFDLLMQWHGRMAQRRQLSELNERLLNDIGVTRIDACRESSKPFWQA